MCLAPMRMEILIHIYMLGLFPQAIEAFHYP